MRKAVSKCVTKKDIGVLEDFYDNPVLCDYIQILDKHGSDVLLQLVFIEKPIVILKYIAGQLRSIRARMALTDAKFTDGQWYARYAELEENGLLSTMEVYIKNPTIENAIVCFNEAERSRIHHDGWTYSSSDDADTPDEFKALPKLSHIYKQGYLGQSLAGKLPYESQELTRLRGLKKLTWKINYNSHPNCRANARISFANKYATERDRVLGDMLKCIKILNSLIPRHEIYKIENEILFLLRLEEPFKK